jgi:DNA-binding NarL/FixJ family response regulator
MAKRVLIVEDDALLALDIAQQMSDAGFEVVGPATSVAKALKLVTEVGCDAAVLDVNLGTGTAPMALGLKARGTPFVVLQVIHVSSTRTHSRVLRFSQSPRAGYSCRNASQIAR